MPKLRIKLRDTFFFLLGLIVATVGNNWSFFNFDKNLSISDLLTALIGGYIGLYVGGKLTSRTSSDRLEKDLIIEEINSIKGFINRLSALVETNIVPLPDSIALFKASSKGLSSIKEMVHICSPDNKLITEIDLILKQVRNLNNSVTSSSPTNGLLTLSQSSRSSFIISIEKINKSLFNLIISINRNLNN